MSLPMHLENGLLVNIGRKTSLNDENMIQICMDIAEGMYLKDAAARVGLSPSTITRWIKLGAKHDIECEYADIEDCTEETCLNMAAMRRFYLNTKIAESYHKQQMLGIITNAAKADPKYWMAAAWSLERRYPQDYGRDSLRKDLPNNEDHKTININITVEKRSKLLSALNKQIEMQQKSQEINGVKIRPTAEKIIDVEVSPEKNSETPSEPNNS